MQIKLLSSLTLAALLAGCGGGGSSHSDNGGSGTTYANSFTITATGDLTGTGMDPDGHLVAVVAQSPSDGVVSSLGYYPASAGKSITFPAGYTLNYVFGVSGHFVLFDVDDGNRVEGTLILNVNTNQSTYEAGREIQAADGDRIMTAASAILGNADFKIETLNPNSVSITDTKSVTLPAGVVVAQLAGDYLLVNNIQVQTFGRAAHRARLTSRADGDFSLYSTSGTKLADYAGATGTTLKYVYNINASGQAVGTVNSTTSTLGASWDKSGKATILPGGGLNVLPLSITDGGTIVGTYAPSATDTSQTVAVSFSGGKETTLTVLGTGFASAGITRNGKGIGTYNYDDTANTSTITAYTIK